MVFRAEMSELFFEVCAPILESVSFSDEVHLVELQVFLELADADTELLPLRPSG